MKRHFQLFSFSVFFLFSALAFGQAQDLGADYEVQDHVIITSSDGASISAIVVRKKFASLPLPTVLQFTIYARERDITSLKEAADHGYVGVMAYSRGKYLSPDVIAPYEHDAKDAYAVIDWISKQSWSNGAVGMYGGSYNGFTQWAATKRLHPALKTIVPYVANRPGMGLPMENNIFINPNYQWTFYVSNNKMVDNAVNDDRARFRKMQTSWWDSGKAYRVIDQIDGTPNPILQRWLQHPGYDHFWQDMVPYQNEFAHITIPVLSIDGYYNDSQVSGLYYLREHTKYRPNAEHYLIIGPYGHFGAQRGGEKILNGMQVDASAMIDTKKITYEWLDYILKQGAKPEVLKDKINYYVIGENRWRHAPSLDQMSNASLQFYLSDVKKNGRYRLDPQRPAQTKYLAQSVDFKDRKDSNNDYYPDPIIRKEIDSSNGFIFVSDALAEDVIVNGSFEGDIVTSINKRDMDFGIVLYELTPEGEYFHLSYVIERASYAKDATRRQLLQANQISHLPLPQTRLISKQLKKGSRIVVYLNVNKNAYAQLNYGTGKDVSDETILDAKEKLKVKWYNQSVIRIPVLRAAH
ncbi:MAG: CocE/NonD family hydrolase [Undibacterium sp.]|nr:CocE/NonD family hydrolase [Undibacterium sp.]